MLVIGCPLVRFLGLCVLSELGVQDVMFFSILALLNLIAGTRNSSCLLWRLPNVYQAWHDLRGCDPVRVLLRRSRRLQHGGAAESMHAQPQTSIADPGYLLNVTKA